MDKVIYKHNGEVVTKEEFSKLTPKNIRGNCNVYISKDKLWEFTDVNTTGKPVQINSKGQWQRHLKKLGLNDDVKQGRSKEETYNSFMDKSRFKPVPREELKKTILNAYQETRRK